MFVIPPLPQSTIQHPELLPPQLGKKKLKLKGKGELVKEQSGWSEVDFVYDPLNYKQHWIMLVIDVNVSRILLYDLLPSYITSRDLIQFLLPLCYTLHSLVDFCNLQASKLDLQPPPWRLSCINCGKLQGSGTLDCGIFCLKFFEYLVTGAGRESLQQSRMLEFRLQYSAELWADQFLY